MNIEHCSMQAQFQFYEKKSEKSNEINNFLGKYNLPK